MSTIRLTATNHYGLGRKKYISHSALRRSVVPIQAIASGERTKSAPKEKGKTPVDAPLQVQRPKKLALEETILFQGFGWDSKNHGNWYTHLASKIPDIQATGATHVWLPPPSKSVSPEGYLPGQLYDLTSKYGTKEDLIALNTALLQAGLRPVADIVINHRSADEQDEQGVWNHFKDDVPHPGKKIDWGPWAITCNDPDYKGKGSKDTGDDYGPSPDVDHANPEVREGLIDWMNWLKDYIGFESWRFDFVKGYAPEFTVEYIEKTCGLDTFNVGEDFVNLQWNGSDLAYDQNTARQRLVDWSKVAKCSAFDFVTKGILQEAVKHTQFYRLKDSKGKPSGMVGWWPERAVTFIDNHDTGSSQNHWPFPKESVLQGYAYILTHPGIPTIFYEHMFDWRIGEEIQKLAQLRVKEGVKANAKIDILCAENDIYVANVDNKLLVKLGPRYDMAELAPKESDGWVLAQSGKDWAVWKKA